MPTTVREALLRMLALIEGGWTKGRNKKMRYGRACYCLSGAYSEATKSQPYPFKNDVWSAVRNATPFHGDPIDYNDAKGRTKQDVVRLLKHAIKLESV